MKCPICRFEGADEPNVPEGESRAIVCATCGSFMLGAEAQSLLREHKDRLHLLSAWLRKSSDAGQPREVAASAFEEMVSSVREPQDIAEGVDRLLLLLAARMASYQDVAIVDPQRDFALIACRGHRDMGSLVRFAAELELYDQKHSRLTLKGWQRIEQLRRLTPNSRQAFVAMWFDPALDGAFRDGFKPGIEASQYFSALRIDQKHHNNRIDDAIVAEIRRSALVVADFTGNRGGVYFEAGLAQGLGIPVIWTCQIDHLKEVHFDIRQYNFILWSDCVELCRRLDDRIRATLLPAVTQQAQQ